MPAFSYLQMGIGESFVLYHRMHLSPKHKPRNSLALKGHIQQPPLPCKTPCPKETSLGVGLSNWIMAQTQKTGPCGLSNGWRVRCKGKRVESVVLKTTKVSAGHLRVIIVSITLICCFFNGWSRFYDLNHKFHPELLPFIYISEQKFENLVWRQNSWNYQQFWDKCALPYNVIGALQTFSST